MPRLVGTFSRAAASVGESTPLACLRTSRPPAPPGRPASPPAYRSTPAATRRGRPRGSAPRGPATPATPRAGRRTPRRAQSSRRTPRLDRRGVRRELCALRGVRRPARGVAGVAGPRGADPRGRPRRVAAGVDRYAGGDAGLPGGAGGRDVLRHASGVLSPTDAAAREKVPTSLGIG